MGTDNPKTDILHWVIMVLIFVIVAGSIITSRKIKENKVSFYDEYQGESEPLRKELRIISEGEETANPNKDSNLDLPTIISEWRERTALLVCTSDHLDYDYYATTYIHLFGGEVPGVRALTNRHAVLDDEGYVFDTCTISMPDATQGYYATSEDIVMHDNEFFDIAQIYLDNEDPYIKSLTKKPVCFKDSSETYLGDQVIIIGYPGIGSTTDITVTEGIVSGYDYPYFITSAKIDEGNSGGLAILTKDNCYLGIPTESVMGEMESLGRILDISSVGQ